MKNLKIWKSVALMLCFGCVMAAEALTLSDFAPVHKANVQREGENQVRLKLPSAEWNSGLCLKPATPLDFSSAKWLAVDAENLSKMRQSRLTMHFPVQVLRCLFVAE